MNKKTAKIGGAGVLLMILLAGSVESSLSEENKQLLEKEAIEELVSQENYQKLIEIYERTIPNLNNDGKGTAYYNLAIAYNKIGNNSSAIANLYKASKYFKKTENTLNYVRTELFLSQLEVQEGLTGNTLVSLKTAIDIAKNKNYSSLAAKGKGILGSFYLKSRFLNEAIEQYNKSLKIERNPNTLIQLSQAYYQQNEDLKLGYDRAVEAVELSQTLKQKINSRISILKYYKSNLSKEQIDQIKKSTIELINSVPREDFKANKLIAVAKLSAPTEAIEYLEGAQKIAEELGSRYTESLANEELGKIYLNNNELIRAKEYTDRSLLISQAIPSPERSFYQSWQLAKISLANGNKQRAIESYNLAFSQLNAQHGEFLFGPNLLFHLGEDARLFLRSYISLLLESNRPQEAIEVLPTLKLAEFQDYFNDPCFDLTINPQQQTDPSTATIHTFLAPERLYLILEYQNKYTLRSVKISKEELEEKIAAYRQVVVLGSATKFISPSKELNEIIIEPIEKSIPEKVKKLIIVRDGAIRSIPIETLIDRNNKYLIKKYEIVYGPGLPGSLKANSKGEKIIFGLTKSTIIRLPLDYIIAEAEAIASATSGRTYIDREFNEEKLALVLSDNKKIALLHIATHGSFSGDAQNSYLETYDGKLSLLEFKQLLLNAEPIALLTLSGCETAAGSEVATLGFAGVAVRARIENVIGALWSIPDNLTALFMEEFYRNRASGMSPAAAKRAAQIAIIAAGESPRSWAGIILIEN